MDVDVEIEADDTWTADAWYALAQGLESAAMDKRIPESLRKQLLDRAETCWILGGWLNGISPEDWAAQCAIYAAEDEAMVARNSQSVTANENPHMPAMQLALELA